jgi:phosphatidylglycerophosphate synthase
MGLHRTTGKPDWNEVAPRRRSTWQRLAAATRGLVTPANVATFVGFGLVLYGLWQLLHEHYVSGGIALAVGRLLDIVDGFLAESTGTKSPLGELLDASIDKIGTILTIIVFFVAGIAPWWALAALLAPHIIISLMTFWLLRRGRKLHPSRIGKLSMAAAWAALLGFVLHHALSEPAPLAALVYGLTILSVVLATVAAVGYSQRKNQYAA